MIAKEVPIEEVLDELGLPKHSVFLGYVIHRDERDEFLVRHELVSDSSLSAWMNDPSRAHIFDDYHEALEISLGDACQAEPYLLFDIGHQLVVTPVGK